MKNIWFRIVAIIIFPLTMLVSCNGPDSDKASMDVKYSGEEQEIDSSRMISKDSTNNTGHIDDGDGH